MSPPPRGRCSVCHRSVVLRNSDGLLRKHGNKASYEHGCKGSGKPPEPAQPEHVEHTHPRRTN